MNFDNNDFLDMFYPKMNNIIRPFFTDTPIDFFYCNNNILVNTTKCGNTTQHNTTQHKYFIIFLFIKFFISC